MYHQLDYRYHRTPQSPPQPPLPPEVDYRYLVPWTRDNYMQSARFYISTFVVLMVEILVLFGYIIMLHWHENVFNLESLAAANLVLYVGLLMCALIWLSRLTREVRAEWALLACGLWLLYTSSTRTYCLCCSDVHHHSALDAADSVFDALNHRIMQFDLNQCSDEAFVIYTLHNAVGITLAVFYYLIVAFWDSDYFTYFDRLLEFWKETNRRKSDSEILTLAVNENAATQLPADRLCLSLALLLVLLVPLACNDPSHVSLILMCCKLLTTPLLVSLRFTNTYLTRYVHYKRLSIHTHLVHFAPVHLILDRRFCQTPYSQLVAPNQQSQIDEMARQWMDGGWLLQSTLDVLVSTSPLFLCDWYLLFVPLQLLIELILLWRINAQWVVNLHYVRLTVEPEVFLHGESSPVGQLHHL